MFNHRAYVAHVGSPLFCENGASPQVLPGVSLQTATASRDLDTPLENETHDDQGEEEDEDDDDDGGVLLTTTTDDTTEARNDSPTVTLHDDVHATTSHTTEVTVLPPAGPSNTNSVSRTRQRPETRDVSVEEDGRRLRLALDGDPIQGTPRFDIAAAFSHGFEPEQMETDAFDEPATVIPVVLQQATQLPAALQARLQEILPLARTIPIVQAARHADEMQIDDDALGVDDPRRHYDVADFMDLWRLRSIRDKALPPFVPGFQSSLRLSRPNEEIARRAVSTGKVDIQGIRWDLIGPSRRDALAARRLIHPSRCIGRSLMRKGSYREEEWQYRFWSFLPSHKAKFNHYQLRNVLTASSRNEVFYATGGQVHRASLACPNQSTTILDLSHSTDGVGDFRITCLAASKRDPNYTSDSMLVAGGFNGEFALLDLDQLEADVSVGFVTHAFNGLVTHVHCFPDRRSGLTQAAFCSNDRKVRLMDVRSLQFSNGFSYGHAINCAATSPDGRLRVLAGDSREILITDAERGYPLATLKDHDDHCFACDWSPDGRFVTAAAQDGKTVIWDARNWNQPWSVQECITSCPRSLNFTDTGALVVAESDDVISVYQGPLFERSQDIRFLGSIAGVALLDGGAEVVIANADRTVGGLLTFERSPFGTKNDGLASAGTRRRRRTAVDPCHMVSDIVI